MDIKTLYRSLHCRQIWEKTSEYLFFDSRDVKDNYGHDDQPSAPISPQVLSWNHKDPLIFYSIC